MTIEPEVVAEPRRSITPLRTASRAVLVILALFLLWAGDRAFFGVQMKAAAQLTALPWGGLAVVGRTDRACRRGLWTRCDAPPKAQPTGPPGRYSSVSDRSCCSSTRPST